MMTLRDRFLAKVEQPATGAACWLWTAERSGFGHGRIGISLRRGVRQIVGAHRIAWQLFRGEIPDGLFVLHRCDNPPCVNPEHLFLGTQRDNVADMNQKGRNGHANKTHCTRGHEFTADNTLMVRGHRRCIACKRMHGAGTNERHLEKRRTSAREYQRRLRAARKQSHTAALPA